MLGLLAVACLISAATKGPKDGVVTYPINGEYNKIIVNAPFDVSYSDTAKAAIVTAPSDIHKQVVVEVKQGVLHILFRGDGKVKKRPTVVLPRNTHLDDVELLGAASLTAGKLEQEQTNIYLSDAASFRGNIAGKESHIVMAGAADYKGHINVENLFVDLSGAASMELRGRVFFKMDFKMIEASSLDAEKLEVRRIEGSLDGGCSAVLWCTERLVVPVKNASNLVYIGHPRVVNCPTSNVSTVTHKQR